MKLDLPEHDEIELSVFGRGFGEAICVHLGEGEWMLADSCHWPSTQTPAALHYLESLGLSPKAAVRLVVATHWHDDHVQGIGDIVTACENAGVVCSAALLRQEILAFVMEQERAKGAAGSGLDELRTLLRVCGARGRAVIWAKANLPLHPRPPGAAPRVVALSPSEDAFERSMVHLIEAATAAKSTIPRRYRAPDGPNGASVATAIQNAGLTLLLGADLETSANTETGWDAVMSYSKPASRACAVKIPHHGSAGAHHDSVWSELVDDDAIAVLTPWVRGSRYLPTDADLLRILELSKKTYITALPSRVLRKTKMDKLVKQLHGAPISKLRGWGHVRARRHLSEKEWRVDLDGDAVLLTA